VHQAHPPATAERPSEARTERDHGGLILDALAVTVRSWSRQALLTMLVVVGANRGD
jgi:hypothetical protein